jgi:hypothetical protein
MHELDSVRLSLADDDYLSGSTEQSSRLCKQSDDLTAGRNAWRRPRQLRLQWRWHQRSCLLCLRHLDGRVLSNPLSLVDPSGLDDEGDPQSDGGCPTCDDQRQFDSSGFDPYFTIKFDVPTFTGSNIPGVIAGEASCAGNCGGFNSYGPCLGCAINSPVDDGSSDGSIDAPSVGAGNYPILNDSFLDSPLTTSADGDSTLDQVVINGAISTPGVPQTPFSNIASFPCGGASCYWTWAPYLAGVSRGVIFKLRYSGQLRGNWIQSISRDGGAWQADSNFGAPYPFYLYPGIPGADNQNIFDPPAGWGVSGSFLANTSFVVPSGNGGANAVFTFVWGYVAPPNGSAAFLIPPAITQPTSFQLGLIQGAKWP